MLIIKKALKIFWLTLVALAAIFSAAALIIQLPQVQTYVVSKVTGKLNDNLNGEISIGKIHFRPFKTLFIKNVLIIDKNPAEDAAVPSKVKVDTFFRAEFITVKLS